eukprot:344617-Hanusia_phi.AAC.1
MSPGDISKVFQQQLLLHSGPRAYAQRWDAPTCRRRQGPGKGGLSKKEFAAVGANLAWCSKPGREAEWT